MRHIRFVIAIAVVASARGGAAQSAPDSLTRHVDQVFSRFTAEGPGCAVGVYQNAKVVLAKGYGLANIEYGVPIKPETPFIMGSVSKQFAAAAIALLVEEGRISLRDDVRKYIPELLDYGTPITIDHLVHHTSGLRDWWELVNVAGLRNDDTYTVDDVLAMTIRQRGLNFKPGDRYLYSNTGYIMLGLVVQRVTGKTLRQFADERIFGPLGMKESHFHDDHTMMVRGRASAYAPSRDGYRINVWNNDLVGQGGVMTTLLDLVRWDENFYTGTVGGPRFLVRQLERGTLNDGTVLSYAFGLEHGTYRGLPIVEHTGSTGGYRTVITRFPAHHTTVTAFCNVSDAAPSTLVRRVADFVLRDKLAAAVASAPAGRGAAGSPPQRQPATGEMGFTQAAADQLVGRYYSDELDASYEVAFAASRLVLRRPRGRVDSLTVRDQRTLGAGALTLRFTVEGAAPALSFVLNAGRVENIIFVRR